MQGPGSIQFYNVEVVSKGDGFEWIRVAQIDPVDFKVLYWGEGYFQSTAIDYYSVLSSHSKPKIESEDYGRYLYLFSGGDMKKDPIILRLVDLKSDGEPILGITQMSVDSSGKTRHMVGTRLFKEPMVCEERSLQGVECFFPN